MARRPVVVINEGYCTLCLRSGVTHTVVTGYIAGEDTGRRLTDGCNATFVTEWRRVTDPKKRRKWVKKFWERENGT